MHSPSPFDAKTARRTRGRRLALWAGLAVGGLLPATGCQVEYAGMTLPSGKYMHDDVQYFPPGPDFPLANTQAATQRARMQAMGLDVPPVLQTGPITPPTAAGAALPGNQNQIGGVLGINDVPGRGLPPAPGAPAPGANPAPNGANPPANPPAPGVPAPDPNAPGGDKPADKP